MNKKQENLRKDIAKVQRKCAAGSYSKLLVATASY
jgi:hypothetical protein